MVDIRFRPLQEWPRAATKTRRQAAFTASWRSTIELLKRELKHLKAKNVVIRVALRESDIRLDGLPRADARRPSHPGVILSFDSERGALSFMCDYFLRHEDNLRGIAMTLERLRLVDLYGVTSSGEQYKGWAALPAPDSDIKTLEAAAAFIEKYSGLSADKIKAETVEFRSAYRIAARKLHPDAGGDTVTFQRLQAAHDILKRHHGI